MVAGAKMENARVRDGSGNEDFGCEWERVLTVPYFRTVQVSQTNQLLYYAGLASPPKICIQSESSVSICRNTAASDGESLKLLFDGCLKIAMTHTRNVCVSECVSEWTPEQCRQKFQTSTHQP